MPSGASPRYPSFPGPFWPRRAIPPLLTPDIPSFHQNSYPRPAFKDLSQLSTNVSANAKVQRDDTEPRDSDSKDGLFGQSANTGISTSRTKPPCHLPVPLSASTVAMHVNNFNKRRDRPVSYLHVHCLVPSISISANHLTPLGHLSAKQHPIVMLEYGPKPHPEGGLSLGCLPGPTGDESGLLFRLAALPLSLPMTLSLYLASQSLVCTSNTISSPTNERWRC